MAGLAFSPTMAEKESFATINEADEEEVDEENVHEEEHVHYSGTTSNNRCKQFVQVSPHIESLICTPIKYSSNNPQYLQLVSTLLVILF